MRDSFKAKRCRKTGDREVLDLHPALSMTSRQLLVILKGRHFASSLLSVRTSVVEAAGPISPKASNRETLDGARRRQLLRLLGRGHVVGGEDKVFLCAMHAVLYVIICMTFASTSARTLADGVYP